MASDDQPVESGSQKAREATTRRRAQKKAAAAEPRELDLKGYSPMVVAAARGILEAAILAALGAAATALTDLDGEAALYAPIAIAAVRFIEGVVDNRIDPARHRRLLGGGRVRG